MKVAPDEPRKAAGPGAAAAAAAPDGDARPDCGCLGAGPPPPHFRLPPPPPPPPLRCTQLPPPDAEDFCDAPPVFQEAEPWGEPALPSAAAIALGCALLLIAAAATASVLLWKYRRKAASGARCSSPRHSQTRSDASSGDTSALYHDAESLRPRALVLRCGATVQTPQGTKHRRGCPAIAGRPVFVCADPYSPHDVCTPVYQEIAPDSPSDPEDHIYAVPVLPGRLGARSPPEELAVGELSDPRPRHQQHHPQHQQHHPQHQQQQQGDVALLEALMQRYSGAFSSHGPGCVGAAAAHSAVK